MQMERVPPGLTARCRAALDTEGVSGGDALAMVAELGLSILSGKLRVYNDETWRKASLEVSQRAAIQTALMLGAKARINDRGDVEISPGEVPVNPTTELMH